MKALINASIFDFNTYKENQFILYDTEIKEVGDMNLFKGADDIYNCAGTIVMPGLINGHTHIYSTFARGLCVPFNPKSFMDILEQLCWKLDRQLNNNAVYYSGLINACECIKNGVTTVIDHHASGLNIKGSLNMLKKGLCDEMGMRGIFCFETSDRFDVDECIEENLSFSKNKSEKCSYLFGLHASLSLSYQTLSKISKIAGDIPIHIHAAESIEDEIDSAKKYGVSVIERLQSYNLINRNSILAHCVHINEKEADIIASKGAVIALNPTSNMNNSVGLPDYELFNKKGIKCILGSDGLGTNISREYLNLVFSMKYYLSNPTAFTLGDLKNIILNSYEYTGRMFGIKLGKIEKGYKADLIVVPYNPPTPINEHNAFSHIFYGLFDNFHPKDTLCDGEFLMKNYKVKNDIKNIYSEGQRESEKLWKRICRL